MISISYKLIMTVGAALLFIGCTPNLMVNTDYDRDADFRQYETFYWSDEFQHDGNEGENNPLFYNTLNKKRLKTAIERELEGKGYTLSENNPDLLVNARVLVEERNTQNYAYGPYSYWGWGYNNYRSADSEKEGDVVIELIDQNQQQLVWQGYASGVLDTDTENRQEEISEAVTIILSKYQHRAGQTSVGR
ncbi:hypothetical protein OKW21_004291 [Catalinimonas alkaloidigena]|uniref:DUF4136 domain-containing protein n=1 Tax=Catalinimonas alkaloidigena TaxID=1075417 RepID=UPI0024056188|nr:DUF4136 domain-containing protein [Catalinimonas alkaloidigena]MDF9799028.1 hypothetical protein [Catalinimonas alkaloidigena]